MWGMQELAETHLGIGNFEPDETSAMKFTISS
jgi:hypothetical protein